MSELITADEALEVTKDNKSFSKVIPGLQTAWDSTSMGALKECPRKYFYAHVLGYRGKQNNPHLIFGGWFHSILEFYDHRRSDGAAHYEAQLAMLRYALDLTVQRTQRWECTECHRDVWLPVETADAPSCCMRAMERIEGDVGFLPWESDDAQKTRSALIRSCFWYTEQFANDSLTTVQLANGRPAVELSFRMELPKNTPEGDLYLACGHLDRVVEMNETQWVLDRKTTKNTITSRFFEGFSPDNQMSLYTMAAQVVLNTPARGVIIDGAQIGVHFTRFQRGFAMRTKAQLEEFLQDFLHYIALAEQYAEARSWPMNDKSCHNYGGCAYRGICGKDPSVRMRFLQAEHTPSPWDPLTPRGNI